MSEYNIKLRSAELVLLRRALKIYAKTYQELKSKSDPQWEKKDLQQMSDAANQLHERLLHNIQPIK